MSRLTLALMFALLAAPMSAAAGTWHNGNVDLPETLGEILTVGFAVTATTSGGAVSFPGQSVKVDASGTTDWVSGRDESGLRYRARLVEGAIEVEVTGEERGVSVTGVTTTLSNAQGEKLASATLTETAERAQEQQRVPR